MNKMIKAIRRKEGGNKIKIWMEGGRRLRMGERGEEEEEEEEDVCVGTERGWVRGKNGTRKKV